MFAVVTLGRVAELATAIYNDKELASRATALRDSVDAAIQRCKCGRSLCKDSLLQSLL